MKLVRIGYTIDVEDLNEFVEREFESLGREFQTLSDSFYRCNSLARKLKLLEKARNRLIFLDHRMNDISEAIGAKLTPKPEITEGSTDHAG